VEVGLPKASGLLMLCGFKFTSILAIVSDFVTVGSFIFPFVVPFMGENMMLITTMFAWCGTALRV
jgi:hypothetical protein